VFPPSKHQVRGATLLTALHYSPTKTHILNSSDSLTLLSFFYRWYMSTLCSNTLKSSSNSNSLLKRDKHTQRRFATNRQTALDRLPMQTAITQHSSCRFLLLSKVIPHGQKKKRKKKEKGVSTQRYTNSDIPTRTKHSNY
jgi:hypothetical protein